MNWKIYPQLDAKSSDLLNYGYIYSQILHNRGRVNESDASKFFNDDLDSFQSYNEIPNIKSAAKKIYDAILSKRKIAIYGDYDVDGIVSSSILFDFLYRKLNANVVPYIPNRFEEGYGLNKNALQKLVDDKFDLVITVDCGIRDSYLVNEFFDKSLDFVITDHHSPPEDGISFYESIPVVHPAIEGTKFRFHEICAANVVWKLIFAIRDEANLDFDPYKYIDLVAMATLCDVMPLIDENRVIVKEGVIKMRSTENVGLKSLVNSAGLDINKIETYNLNFILGPRLNASGRMDDAMIGLRLLTTYDANLAQNIAGQLEALNKQRQMLTTSYIEAAMIQAQDQVLKGEKLIFIIGENWSEGIVGLVAGKIMEKYYLPTLVATKLENEIKGSARSVSGINITEEISKHKSLLLRFGGHSQAAGFTLKDENLDEFMRNMQSAIAKKDIDIFEKDLRIDMVLGFNQIDNDLAIGLDRFEPFGLGNPTPIFCSYDCTLISISLFGSSKNHTKLLLRQKDSDKIVHAIAFNQAKLADELKDVENIDIAYTLNLNRWNGQEFLQFFIKDVKAK